LCEHAVERVLVRDVEETCFVLLVLFGGRNLEAFRSPVGVYFEILGIFAGSDNDLLKPTF